jgi:hypothetical protein
MRRSATFLPSEEVQRIRVSQNVGGRQIGDVCVLEDPGRIAQLHAFLEEHEDGWEPIWGTPRSGDYSILMESGDTWQSIFIVRNAIQTNSDGVPVERELSAESHQQLLALLGIESPNSPEGLGTATLASHSEGEQPSVEPTR